MKKIFNNFKDNRLLLLILVVILIPNIIEESLSMYFDFDFENEIWYEVVDTTIVLCIAIPMFIYLIRKMDDYSFRLKKQLVTNTRITNELKLKNKELNYQAYHDYLTGLPNRYKLFEDLERIVTKTDEKDCQKLKIMFVDLDDFKRINDTLGHEIGDLLVEDVAQRLKAFVPESDLVYRYGGDEFIILLENIDQEMASEVASGILESLNKKFLIKDKELYTTASIGISVYPRDGQDEETLLKKADRAMYIAKESGKNKYLFYPKDPEDPYLRKIRIEGALKQALVEGQFSLNYQPIIDLATGKIVNFEALLRWNHPQLGTVSPGEFIPIAEEIGMIISIGRWVFETASAQLKQWQERYSPTLSVSVNVSILQMKEETFSSFVADVLKRNQLDPIYMNVEVTETMFQDTEEAIRTMHALKGIGVEISIDDFGTGYSSLSTLRDLPMDYLKIDQSFTRDMLKYPGTASIVKTIINLGHLLDLQIIAEGIEEEAQALFFKEHNCHFGQGYFYSKPLTQGDVEKVLEKEKTLNLPNPSYMYDI